MDINRYGFGIQFDIRKLPIGIDIADSMLLQIFSAASAHDLKEAFFFGGESEGFDNEYFIIIDNMSFGQARRLRKRIEADSGLALFLDDETPFWGKNRLRNELGALPQIGAVTNGEFVYADRSKSIKLNKRCDKKLSFVLAPDKFKGSLSSLDAVRILTISARKHFLGAKIQPQLIADGGEGSTEAFVAAQGGEYKTVRVSDPLGREVEAKYAILNPTTALIETAQASGLALIEEHERDVLRSSSYGTGEMILAALKSGFTNILVSLGGSATNDGGMGLARALGVKFYDDLDNELLGCGADLLNVRRIDLTQIDPLAKHAKFTALCDVKNPLLGLDGAAMTFSPQKGADAKTMFELESGMKNFRRVLFETTGVDVAKVEGAGAAGGIAAVLHAVFNAEIKWGIDTLLELIKFDKILENTSLVVTGEGRLDSQTVKGNKAVYGILEWCNRAGVPVAVIAGSVERGLEINANIIPIAHSDMSIEYAIQNASVLLMEASDRLFSLLAASRRMRCYESKLEKTAKKVAKELWRLTKIAAKFLWKYIKIIAKFLWKWLKIIAKELAKLIWWFLRWLWKQIKLLFRRIGEKMKE